jgi:ABC-type multidrug transport system ATPase subunit
MGLELLMLSMACELVTYAPVVILDDPFNSIDATYAGKLMGVLEALSHRGHTVICTIR